jgi:Xaa-Pro aminopeptidase
MRIDELAKMLSDVDACIIDNPVDLLYLTGLSMSKGRLWVGKESTLFVDGRYFETARKKAPCAVKIWDEQKNQKEKRVGFDSAFVSYNEYLSLQKMFPEVEWVPIASPTKQLRVCKDAGEIAALKKACKLTYLGYERVKECLKVGVTEAEMAFEFEMFCRKNGASGLSFDSIIAFGENGAYPHHRAGPTKLQKDQMVLIDVGAVVDLYHGDMTRVVHFGTPDPRVVEFEEIVRRAQKKAIAHVKPGIRAGELDQIVRDEFDKHNVKPLYIHNLGHGIGLDTHEFPRIRFDSDDGKLVLKPGMVFTVEPGLYQPGVGGVRWEDMVLVTETGCEVLSDV